MQSGGSTAVLNRSLLGVVREAYRNEGFGEVFGAVHGLEGLLSRRLIDLSKQTKGQWSRIAHTPGAILGSSRRKLRPEDVPTALDVLSEYDIRFLFTIGGNDSAETAQRIGVEARAAGRPLTVINVPKTIDNDLALTDHSPGYGSAARFVALATMGAGRDAETMGEESPVTIIEVMGRDAGWLAAAAALGRRSERDAPHLICVPEVPVEERRFLEGIEEAYRRFGFAVAVVAENARGVDGVLGGQQEPWYVDEFGHSYFEGAGHYLAALAGGGLGVRVRYERPGTIQRSMVACVSSTDAREAEMVGRAAVRYVLQGVSGQMVTLVREGEEGYACSTGLAPLEEVAGKVQRLPEEYFDPASQMATRAFLDYARPLIGAPLPRYADRPDLG
jgi:6-phosphofructokinase 1